MSEILRDEDEVLLSAVEEMIRLGVATAKRFVDGKKALPGYEEKGDRILKLLFAYQQKDNLTDKQREAILYDLKELTTSDSTIDALAWDDDDLILWA